MTLMPMNTIDSPLFAVLADGVMLTSPYKPVLFVITVSIWAWVVATIYDKDAARWYFKREAWNATHITVGLVAVLVFLFTPLMFWITWPIIIAILFADLAIYAVLRNRDDRVPETHKWSFDLEKMKAARAEAAAASGGSDKKKKKKGKGEIAKGITLTLQGKKGVLPVPEPDAPEYAIRAQLDEILVHAMTNRGTQLDIGPVRERPNAYAATVVVDSVREAVKAFPAKEAVAMIDMVKSVAGLDVEDRRRRLRGKIDIVPPGARSVDATLVTLGTSEGVRLSMTFSPEAQVDRRISGMGFLPPQEEMAIAMVGEGSGTVLLTAPPDQGRTSTMYAFLREHDAYTSNVQTLEMEASESTLEGIRQNIFDPAEDGAEFATTVRSILRRDPSVVGISDMPDEATALEVSRSDHERTRVYLSFKADGALQAVQLFARAVGDQRAAADSIYGVVNQRLIRRLCDNCRVPYQPNADVLKKLGLPKDTKQLYRKGGQVLVKDKPQTCPVCGGSGFVGVLGIFEIHRIGVEERRLISANDLTGLKALFRQRREPSLQSAAMQRVLLGETSVEEVVRVTSPRGGSAKPKAKTPPERPPAPQGA